MDKSAKVVKYY